MGVEMLSIRNVEHRFRSARPTTDYQARNDYIKDFPLEFFIFKLEYTYMGYGVITCRPTSEKPLESCICLIHITLLYETRDPVL